METFSIKACEVALEKLNFLVNSNFMVDLKLGFPNYVAIE